MLASRFIRIWGPLYVLAVVGIVLGMQYARQRAREVYGTSGATADWQRWVADARAQADGKGPVRRRVPKSTRPPAAVLMEDHYPTCLGGALILGSALFWSLAFLVQGALVRPDAVDLKDEEGPRPPRAARQPTS